MDFLSEGLGFLGTVLTGGATGIVGTVISGVARYFGAKQEERATQADREHEYKLHELNMRAGAAETERELLITEATTSADLRMASYAHDTGIGRASRWVINILRLVRPSLTAGLLVMMGAVWIMADPAGMGIEIRPVISNAIVYLGVTAVTWWFGDRGTKAFEKR
jgi:hypothetical protein